MLKKKILSLFTITLVAFAATSCGEEPSETPSSNSPTTVVTPSGLKVHLEGTSEALDSVDVLEEASVKLVTSYIPTDIELTFTWTVGDPTIATAEDGVVTGVKAGTTTLSVACKEYPNLTKLLFVNVKDKVGQKGVGSGKSEDDPVFIGNEGSQEPIEIFFIEVQQMYADAVYIRKGNLDCLIDAGQPSDGPHVRHFLETHMRDKRLDMVMVSHTHADHYGGMAEALKAVDDVSLFIDYGGDSRNSYSDARDEFIAKGSDYYQAYDCVNYRNGGVKEWYLTKDFKMTILDTGNYVKDFGSAANPESVAAILSYKDFTYYTAGDLTSEIEKQMITREQLSPVSLYKASHHGSHGSNTTEILNVLDPYMAGISAAITGNTPEKQTGISGHPAAAAIERMYKAPRLSQNLNIYWNGVNGDMCFTTYGGETDITFKGTPTNKGYYENVNGQYVKVTGEDDKKIHESKVFKARGYEQYLPDWAKEEFGYTK